LKEKQPFVALDITGLKLTELIRRRITLAAKADIWNANLNHFRVRNKGRIDEAAEKTARWR